MNNATTIRLRPIPSPDTPRRDPAVPAKRPKLELVGQASPHSYSQETLGLAFAAPTTFVPVIAPDIRSAPSTAPTRIFSIDEHSADQENAFFERQMTSSDKLPAPREWACGFAQAVVEVIAGQRPPRQIARHATHTVLSGLSKPEAPPLAAPQARRQQPGRRSIVTSVRVDEPADGVAEVAAVVRGKNRSRALTLRLEGWDGRWICTFAAMV